MEHLLNTPGVIRVAIFLAVLVLLVAIEAWRRGPNPPVRRKHRWPSNGGLALVDTLLARLLLPAGAVGAALWAQSRGLGLFNATAWPAWLEFGLALVLLDLAIYWQHRWLHAFPVLWRLHRVHHTDATLDATSALRFHPLEILLSLAYKVALAVALGVAPLAMLVFEVLLSSFALFTHANLSLPAGFDRVVRRLLVTPAMHRIHHSVHGAEQRRNFGFNLSLWDRAFGSYAAAHRDPVLRIGVQGVGGEQATRFGALLREPFVDRGRRG
ncbi:sterol desaturase family protein [Luteimonas vadosa]|uniref:Sterol desaturase family protein n=1 Tax=Luteimonas vadosa TaxID=1165507 RepID=A0ABP9DRB8_9GAMM